MPSRRRPKAPPPAPLSDLERFAQAIRESEDADRRAAQSAADRKADAERRKVEVVEQAARLERARQAHKRAVELVKEAKRSGQGAAAADLAWREAKAHLIELETGDRPAWAARVEQIADVEPAIDDEQSTTDDEEQVGDD